VDNLYSDLNFDYLQSFSGPLLGQFQALVESPRQGWQPPSGLNTDFPGRLNYQGYNTKEDVEEDIAALRQECAVTAGLMQQAISDNAHAALDQEDYQRHYDNLASRFEEAKGNLDRLEAEKRERGAKQERIRWFIRELRRQEGLMSAFDEHVWNVLAESITVFADRTMRLRFRDGTEITV